MQLTPWPASYSPHKPHVVQPQFAMDFTGGSAAALVLGPAGGTHAGGPAVLGPALRDDMDEPTLVAALNAWGTGMHREVLALRSDLGATQAAVSGAFVEAEASVRQLVTAFRIEVVAMRQTTALEAQASLARLGQVVEEARARFDTQDARFTTGLAELAQRMQAVDTWAQAEPSRIAAAVQAVPAPWLGAARHGAAA